ncbi:MAG: cobyric acid synthase [Jatrophihabitans sp.]|uniref:cobyric acid synthase n=1 Tax=Jatrophihabitans sp. TaxID=1932789 RepID=UPI003F7F3BEF
MRGSLLVAGASSDAGKSLLTAGICRWLRDRDVRVAPFKAQNMSNNSAVTIDGGEIGRAQEMQARACRVEPTVDMNPVLLKPGGDTRSHVLVHGRPFGEAGALEYRDLKTDLRAAVLQSYDRLRTSYEVVICEGAGSPAEINLRSTDLANMWLARERALPTVVVGDIDRGGVFAALVGTLAVLEGRDQSLVAGFLINKFRGDARLLAPGLDQLRALTGRPMLGVVPWLTGIGLDAEDSLSLTRTVSGGPPVGDEALRVVAVRLPRTSNATDLDALGCEPGVVVQWTVSPAEVAAADLAVLPGSRATVRDLAWLRSSGIADVIVERARRGRPTLGICGGHQMLAATIVDEIESRAGKVDGLGLLPTEVRFAVDKTVRRSRGTWRDELVDTAYEIHHGITHVVENCVPFLDGQQRGAVWGTSFHGAFDSDRFRRAFLREVADAAGRQFVPAPDTDARALRERQLDLVGAAVAEHLDTAAVERLITDGAPAGLPPLRTTLGDRP